MAKKASMVSFLLLLPTLATNFKKLAKRDKRKWKMLLLKFVRSTAFYMTMTTVPALLCCFQTRYYGKVDRLGPTMCFIVGIVIAVLLEQPTMH